MLYLGRYFASASSERFINLWDANPESANKRPLLVFNLDSAPLTLRFSPLVSSRTPATESEEDEKTSDSSSVYSVFAVSENSTAHVWEVSAAESSDVESPRKKEDETKSSMHVVASVEISVAVSKKKRSVSRVTAEEGKLFPSS